MSMNPLRTFVAVSTISACGALVLQTGHAANATTEITEATKFTDLNIVPGAALKAAAGHNLTMTVDGVESDILPGHFQGQIVLTPTEDVRVHFTDMGANRTDSFRAGIYVDDGAYIPGKSVAAAVSAGRVTDRAANNIVINSHGKEFNGIVITGTSNFAINRPAINFTGNGRNDFDGLGAAIKVDGHSNVTIDHATLRTKGVTRTAIWVGDHGTATINNSDIEVADGTLPADYSWSWLDPAQSKDVMLETPWMLGIRGNNRATLVVADGTVHYNHTHIRAEAWGALSTDNPKGEIKLYANDCVIETVRSGYGAYTVGNTLDSFSNTRFEVADYGLIMASGSALFTNGSVVNSRRIGVMAHGGASGTLTVNNGSVIRAEKAVIQLKSSSPDIVVEDAKLISKSGVILEAFVNDDPDNGGSGPPPASSAPAAAGAPPPPPVKAGRYNAPHKTKDIVARFKNVNLHGDFINALTAQSGLDMHLVHAHISGAITTATATHKLGRNGEKLVMQDKPDLYYLIGEVTETYAPTDDPHGVAINLDATSHWEVSSPSYITALTLAPGGQISAPTGYRLEFTVNGVTKPMKPGHYEGRISLKPMATSPVSSGAMGSDNIDEELKALATTLNLAQSQASSARRILAERQTQILAVRAQFPAPRPGASPPPDGPVKMRAVMEAAHAKMLAILSPAQQVIYNKIDTTGTGPPPAAQ